MHVPVSIPEYDYDSIALARVQVEQYIFMSDVISRTYPRDFVFISASEDTSVVSSKLGIKQTVK